MRFFLSAEYDFKTKKWISGGKIIPNHAWAKSKQHEISFPVLNDQIMFLHNKYYWNNREKWGKFCNTLEKDLFKIVIFSSNDPNYGVYSIIKQKALRCFVIEKSNTRSGFEKKSYVL